MNKHGTAIVLFTQDLRVHDQPALAAAAAEADRVVPLFVFDEAILAAFGAPNRVAFLLDSLADLRRSLTELGAPLVLRRGDVVGETLSIARRTNARAVYLSSGVSAYSRARERRLAAAIDIRRFPGVTVVPPGEVTPAKSDHYRVFTPYWRRWSQVRQRALRRAPVALRTASGIALGRLPRREELVPGQVASALPPGGEAAARERLARFLRGRLGQYGERPLADGTSRLSPYLHFGCLSPLEVAARAREWPGGEAFVRQLAWRDFYQQLLAANPRLARDDYRPRGDRWNDDDQGFEAWREGRTGLPIVDAAMRQLLREGWMPNRGRLLAASFLVKDLRIDWRRGAQHFFELLVDGDLANNAGNWQWVAGTGTDTRPSRVFNPIAQAKRFDPDGEYVRRYLPELASLEGAAAHQPWRLPKRERAKLDYPAPLVVRADLARRQG